MAPGLPCAALALGLLLLPGTRGDCGVLPRLSHANPSDVSAEGSFPINTQVTYRCLDGFVKIPGKSDTVVCLPNSQWSNIEEFCGRSCDAPRRLKFAALNKEDETKSIYPVGITVGYTCRPGYEINTEMHPVSTCLENFTWSEVPEFCSKKSCGHPGDLLHGKAVSMTEFLFGERVTFQCEEGYKLIGRPSIQCLLDGAEVKWSKLPMCHAITCPPPPSIANGTSNGRDVSAFTYNSTVTYRCDSGFQLIGVASIRCTTKDKTNGIWSGLPPNCTDTRGQRGVQFKGNERSRTSLGSPYLSNSVVPERHQKNKIKSKPKTPPFQKTPITRYSLRTVGKTFVLPLFRFATPAYISSNYCSVRTKGRCVFHQTYMGISGVLPSTKCFQYLKWPEVPGFCGNLGCPREQEHGRTAAITDFQFSAGEYFAHEEACPELASNYS